MDTPSSENCLPTLGPMPEAKLNTTNSNTKKDTDMSTKAEDDLIEFLNDRVRLTVE